MDHSETIQRIMEHVRVLSEDIGPRGSTTEGEEKAARYIQSMLEKQKMEVWTEEFLSPSTFSWYYAVPNLIIFISFIVFLFHPLLGLLLSIIGGIFFFTEINTIETISRFFPKKRSGNVLGRLTPEREVKNKIVIVTHHDTSKPSLSFRPRYIKYFRASIVLMIISVFLVPAALSMRILLDSGGILMVSAGCLSFYLLASVLVLIHRELVYEPVCGANDNASGTGVVLALGETLSAHPPENTELWFLSTGCEEVGAIGMMRFLKRHGEELKDAYFINIDNVGKGDIRYTEKEGLIKAFSCSKELVNVAWRASKEKNINAKKLTSKVYPTNALPCLVRNHRAVSILATDEKGLIYNWHWSTDTYDKLEENTMNRAYILVLEMVRLMDTSGIKNE